MTATFRWFMLVAVLFSMIAGICIGYYLLRPVVAAAKKADEGLAHIETVRQHSYVRFRATILSIAEDRTSLTVVTPDMYDPVKKNSLTIRVAVPQSMSAGQQVLVDVERSPGLLQARNLGGVNII